MKKTILLALILMVTALWADIEGNHQDRCDRRYEQGRTQLSEERYNRAITTLSQVRLECIGGIDDPDSLYYFLGEAYLNGGSPNEARLEYRTIVEDYPHSDFREESFYKMALCSYLAAPIIERDSRLLRQAMREFNSFMAMYPAGPYADSAAIYVDSIYNKLIDKEIANAEFYEIVERWDSAIIYYRTILEDYPGNDRTDYIKLQIIENLVSDHRFTEARAMMAELESRNVYTAEIAEQEGRIESFLNRQTRQTRRDRRRARAESIGE